MQKFTTEDAITWVDQNAKQIIGHSRKYLPFAPYDQEDFLQDAYEAALEATKVSTDRQVPFPACFWILFKGKVSAVTPNPGSKRNDGSSSPPRTTCDWSDFSAELFNRADSTDHSDPLLNIDIDQVYPFVRQYLTPAEEQVLEALLGVHEGAMKIKEAARYLGCSPANIRQTLNRACNRISNLVASGELNIEFIEGEIVHLPPSVENNTLVQLEAVLETQDSEVSMAKTNKRRDEPSEEIPDQVQPIRYQGSPNRRTSDSHTSPGTKTLQTPLIDRKIVLSEHLPLPSIGMTSYPAPVFSELGNPGKVLTWKDLMGSHPERMTSWLNDFRPADMMRFVASKQISTARIIAPHIQRQSRQGPKEDVTCMRATRAMLSTVAQMHSQNCRDGPNFIFPGKSGADPPVKRNQPPPVTTQRRGRTIDLTCRNRPVYIFSDIPPDELLVEQNQPHLAA
jgi:hypothetical protein